MKNEDENILMTYITSLLAVASNGVAKIATILSTVQGWLLALRLALANFIAGYELALLAVVVCFLSDAVWGILASRKQKKYSRSGLARHTLVKGACYMNILVVFLFIDKILPDHFDFTTGLMATIICLVELWSIAGNVLIVDPNIPVLRLLRTALRGEIAHKLKCDEDSVEDVLNKMHQNKKKK